MAEHAYQDVSGKKIIAGTFTGVTFTKRPVHQEIETPDGTKQVVMPGGMHGGAPYAYISMTDVGEDTQLRCQFVNLTKNEVLFGTQLTVDCKDRLETVEIILPLPPLMISEEGAYAFELVCEDEILGSCRIKATELKHSGDN